MGSDYLEHNWTILEVRINSAAWFVLWKTEVKAPDTMDVEPC